MKLTKAQRRTLERMASGDEVMRFPFSNSSTWKSGHVAERAPGIDTLSNLRKRRLIKRTDVAAGTITYAITEAGRKALSESQATGE